MNENAIYRQLQKEIDSRMPIGFPKSKSGLDVKILKELFSPEEAKITMNLSALKEPIQKIYDRLIRAGMTYSLRDLELKLKDMLKRGLIMGDATKNLYSLAHFAVGFYEFQVDKQSKALAEYAEKYLRETFYREFHKKGVPTQIRTIPIEQSLTAEHHVAAYDNIIDIINKTEEPFTVINCVCRQSHDLIGEKCKLSDIRRCCVLFHAKDEIDFNVDNPEEISREQLLFMMKDWQKAGFVLQTENAREPRYMCVCCGCCCGVLQAAKQFPKPAEFYSNNYYAVVDAELCNGCQTCVKRCQMDAISIVDDKAKVNLDRCIGCGNCVPTCSMKAMSLKKKEKIVLPPKNRNSLYNQIMLKKKGLVGSVGLIGKILFGRKI